MKIFNLNQGELDTMVIFERIKKKELTQQEAAQILKISDRQIRRKLKRYNSGGPAGLVHKGRGKRSNRAIETPVTAKILELIQGKYSSLKEKAGPTFLADQLAKTDGIIINHETLRRLMITSGLWTISVRKRRRHQWRERKHHFGELVLVDGSLHVWFGNEYSTLIAFIDDATGRILWAEFVDRESTKDLGKMTYAYVKRYGRPLILYSDRGSAYKISNNKDGKQHLTQYQRMLQELDIELIHARSPQAKGRVERLFKTLQDRLVKELELANIKTRGAANNFLKNSYLPEHNKKFAVLPQEEADFHRSIAGFDLHAIVCLKFERIINNDYTIRIKDKWFQLEQKQPMTIRRKQCVTVHEHFDGTIDIVKSGTRLAFKKIAKQTSKPKAKKEKDYDRRGQQLVYRKPAQSHPWRSLRKKQDISIELSLGHI